MSRWTLLGASVVAAAGGAVLAWNADTITAWVEARRVAAWRAGREMAPGRSESHSAGLNGASGTRTGPTL